MLVKGATLYGAKNFSEPVLTHTSVKWVMTGELMACCQFCCTLLHEPILTYCKWDHHIISQ